MDSTGQIFQITKFTDTLSFIIIPRTFGRNLKKIGQINIPYKFAQSGCIPLKIKCEILAPKGSQTTRATPGDFLSSWNRKPIGQRDLLASMKMDEDFPGKVSDTFFFFYLDRSVERWGGRRNIEQNCKRQRQNPRQKWKNRKTFWGARQGIDIQLSKLRFEAIVDVFISRLVLAWKKGNFVFNITYAHFGLPATSLFEIWMPA